MTGDRIDILRAGLIRFTPPCALNDPWEMSPIIKGMFVEGWDEDPLHPSDELNWIECVPESVEEQSLSGALGNPPRKDIARPDSELEESPFDYDIDELLLHLNLKGSISKDDLIENWIRYGNCL